MNLIVAAGMLMAKKIVNFKLGRRIVSVEIDDKPIPVDSIEIIALYNMLEHVNHLMHQPLYYRDGDLMDEYARKLYPEIARLYYRVLWELLPAPVRAKIEEH